MAEDRGAPTAEELAAQAIADIGNARAGTIIDLVNQWRPAAEALGYPADAWAMEFAGLLQGASDAQLYDIQNAANYDGVRAILQGRSAPVSLDGVAGAEALGDSSSDLTFTPSVPCRIIDTRYDTDGGTKPTTSIPYHYYVQGTAATLYTQGHNLGVNSGPGCPAPKGEAAGIAANFTVASPAANGNIRAWPYGSATPSVSLLNYQANANLANAGIVATCYGCGYDMSMMSQYGSTHWIVDTMGFFYPTVPLAGSNTWLEWLYGLTYGYNYLMNSSTFTPTHSGKCLVMTHAEVNTASTDVYNGSFVRTAAATNGGSPSMDGNYGQYLTPTGKSYATISTSNVWDVSAGNSYEFGCMIHADGDFIGNYANCRTTYMCY
jgi:hypothetical protein